VKGEDAWRSGIEGPEEMGMRVHSSSTIALTTKENNRRNHYRERTRPGSHLIRAMIDARQWTHVGALSYVEELGAGS